MSTDDNTPQDSPGGSTIYRHGMPSEWRPPAEGNCLQQISEHIERHLGPIEAVFHEVVSDTVHIDLHWVKPTADAPFARLITSGMSDLPMSVPDDSGLPAHLELMITLPEDWRFEMSAFEDERWYWPIRLLKTLARLPHKYDTWLGWGHTVPNGDPAEPYADNVKFTGAILLPPVTAPEEFFVLPIDEHKSIGFLAVYPLFAEEMDLKLRRGTDALLDGFVRHAVSDIVDPRRRNVAKKRFGLF
jgi:hypothetical protein